MMSILELKHLKKYYGSSRGIEDVSLKINKGDIYGFIGPNGAGKSTTIRTIMGLINKTSGEILFDGKPMNPDDPNTIKRIGYLPSEINLYEAGFVFNEVLVLADVVHKSSNGEVSVYEIKNSLSVKDVFLNDLNLQQYVIRHCVKNLVSFSLVYNDGNDSPIYEDKLKEAQDAENQIAEQVERMKDVIQGFEPDIKPGEHCSKPYDCVF